MRRIHNSACAVARVDFHGPGIPVLLWIIGVAITFLVREAHRTRSDDQIQALLHVIKRSAIIFGVGLLLNGFPYYNWATIRIPGVLQRIAICYLIAATIFLIHKNARSDPLVCGAAIGILDVDEDGPSTGVWRGQFRYRLQSREMGRRNAVIGHMYSRTKTWDPEGVVSTLPAVTNVLFGIFAGQVCDCSGLPPKKRAGFFAWGRY